MYGLLLQNVHIHLIYEHGEKTWDEIVSLAGLEQKVFSTHEIYPESLIPRIVDACSMMTGVSKEEITKHVGTSFVNFLGGYGYNKMLHCLGRNLSEFLNGLDNLHEYLRFSYPKLQPPSFFCDEETSTGMRLHYRSSRAGYIHYVVGQIQAVPRQFYNSDVEISVLVHTESNEGCYACLQLNFDNSAGFRHTRAKLRLNSTSSLSPLANAKLSCENPSQDTLLDVEHCMAVDLSSVFPTIFPFHLAFDKQLTVIQVGYSLGEILQGIRLRKVLDVFLVVRPKIELSWKNVSMLYEFTLWTRLSHLF